MPIYLFDSLGGSIFICACMLVAAASFLRITDGNFSQLQGVSDKPCQDMCNSNIL